MGFTGQTRPPWTALYLAIADTLLEMAGFLLTRTLVTHSAGAVTLTTESTDRFPDAGRLVSEGAIFRYSGRTPVSFTGITHDDGVTVGLPRALPPLAQVQDLTRETSQLDDLRASFLIEFAEGSELDIIARNYGISRPRGLTDVLFRPLLQVWIYLDAQTIYAIEKVLDVLLGAGNYTLYEDLEAFMHTVFVQFSAGSSTSARGKAFLVGGEPQPATGATTVDVSNPPRVVYGVYDAADPSRVGTNYAHAVIAATTNGGNSIFTGGSWLMQDLGKAVIVDFGGGAAKEHWIIQAVAGPNQITVAGKQRNDGSADGTAPDRFTTGTAWWAPWMVGHAVQILSGPNAGNYTIAEIVSHFTVRFTTGGLATDTDSEWRLSPRFPLLSACSVQINRTSFAGLTITTPVGPLPASLLVDYTHIPSAQTLLNFSANGDDQWAFYLWDEGSIIRVILDLITASGVQVVIVPE